MRYVLLLLVGLATLLTPARGQSPGRKPVSRAEFMRLMQTIADGLNENNPRKAANCFALDAIYSEPPNRQLYRGRERLFDVFGGEKGRTKPMRMQWHHLVFDEQSQVGSGEFSLTNGPTVHGMTSVKIRDGLIGNWRQYTYESTLDWNAFILQNPF